jgi:inositol phosphorylceramide mannosyltransferase catalytic subunit
VSESPPSVTIPRIIHQIWYQGASEVPPRYRAFRDGWRKTHPDWEHRLWDQAACRALLVERYPHFLAAWAAYPLFIQRIDSIRYFILNTHGGVYLDMDMECLRPLDPLLEGCDLLLSRTVQYNIAAMAGVPDHPLWRRALAGLTETAGRRRPRGLARWRGGDARLAAETAGPIFFARMVKESGADADPRTRVCPGHTFEPRAPTLVDGRLHFRDDLSGSYAIHHEALSWMPWWHRRLSQITRPLFRLAFGRSRRNPEPTRHE